MHFDDSSQRRRRMRGTNFSTLSATSFSLYKVVDATEKHNDLRIRDAFERKPGLDCFSMDTI
jgi:hypothetical protein